MQRINIISLSDTSWDGSWMNRQQLLSRLGKRHNILYSNGLFHTWQVGLDEWKQAPLLSRFMCKDSVKIHIPGKILLRNSRSELYDEFIIKNEVSKWKKQFENYESTNLTYIWGPGYKKYVDLVGSKTLVYHVYDLFEKQPGWAKQNEYDHHWLLDRADLVVASSEQLASHLETIGKRKIHLLENGVDYQAFSNHGHPLPNDLKNIPHPILMYVGTVNRKVDLSLVDVISEQKPDWHWVFVGKIGSLDEKDKAIFSRLQNRDNVHFLGCKNYLELPAYEDHADINVMVYKEDPGLWTQAGYPLKLNEYLAIGKPVISAYLPTLEKYADIIFIARSKSEWINAIEDVFKGNYRLSAEKMRETAKANDWDAKVELLDSWLRELLP